VIVVDASAIIAVLQDEPEKGPFKTVIANDDRALVSAVSALEAGIVMRARHGEDGLKGLFDFFAAADIEVAAFDEVQAKTAIEAYGRYGKGLNPTTRLNLGDCAAYALAKTLNVPLLFKGADFGATDIQSAL
jgi:ribonuclease VapC